MMSSGPNVRSPNVQIECACGCGKKFYVRPEELEKFEREGIRLLSPRCKTIPFGWDIVEVRNDITLIRQTIPGYDLPRKPAAVKFVPVFHHDHNSWP